MIDTLVLTEGQGGVAAIDGAAAGIHQMGDAVVAAALEDVAEAHQVGLDVGGGVLEGVAHAGLGGEIHHPLRGAGGQGIAAWALAPEGGLHRGPILQIALDQGKRHAPGGGQVL